MPPRGSGMFGPDVLVGTAEYWKKYREKNLERMKLNQKKYLLRQRELALAVELAAGKTVLSGEEVSVADALVEVEEKLKDISIARKEQIAAGIAPVRDQIPFVLEEAERHNVPYEVAFKVMDDPDYNGEESWHTFLLTYPPPEEEAK